MGLSGAFLPAAETAYSQARVLWRSQQTTAATAAEVCSDPLRAIALLNKALALEPEYAEAYIRRGLAKSELGQFEAAFDDASAALRLRPEPAYYAQRALISMRAGQYDAARLDLEYSIQRDDSLSLSWALRGMLNLMENRAAEACRDFSRACSNGDCSRLDAARQEQICP
jgi:tetratricopeptide (TPR) repeat protein